MLIPFTTSLQTDKAYLKFSGQVFTSDLKVHANSFLFSVLEK